MLGWDASWLSIVLASCLAVGQALEVYTNHFHVHTKEPGIENAHKIAKRHGFINRGPVLGSDKEFHFVQPALSHARTRRSVAHHAKLHKDDDVCIYSWHLIFHVSNTNMRWEYVVLGDLWISLHHRYVVTFPAANNFLPQMSTFLPKHREKEEVNSLGEKCTHSWEENTRRQHFHHVYKFLQQPITLIQDDETHFRSSTLNS